MRTFFAVFFHRQVTDAIARNQDRCRDLGVKGKYVDPENIHLTVKFIGEIDPQDAERMEPLASEVAGVGSLTLQLDDLGIFPPKGRPKVLWQGLSGTDIEKLKSLHQQVEDYCAETIDVEREKRKFHPHVTLARSPNIPTGINIKGNQDIDLEKPIFQVDYLSLMKSELSPKGPGYKALKHFKL